MSNGIIRRQVNEIGQAIIETKKQIQQAQQALCFLMGYLETANEESKANFCLKVCGDGMKDLQINDGDLVAVRKQDTFNNGDICVVILNNVPILKQVFYYPDKKQILLQSNAQDEPLLFNDINEVEIVGKVTYCLKSIVPVAQTA